ncbi:MAG: VWA domain-containing protein [Methylococcales bacterium]|nr:VWA domain-containing protein [Methylococcales bacterium]
MNWAEFHFIRPYCLLALIPFVAMLVLLINSKLRRGNWSAVCDPELLPYLLQDKQLRQSRWPLSVIASAAFLAILAWAGPTWQRLPAPVFRNESALVIALDLSRSMDAADIKPSRLIMARYKIADILKQRKDGQTALLVYAGDAFTVTPLTDDTETIDSQLNALNTDIMPSAGSNTELVLEKAQELFKQAGLQQGQILLVTDGVDSDKALPAVKALDGYSLSVLGVGTADGAPIAQAEGGFLKDAQGGIVVPKLNADELARLAQAGKGSYQTLSADDSDIKALLAAMPQSAAQQGKENENLRLDLWQDQGPWLLLLVLPLAALGFRKGLLCFALLVLLPLPKNSYALEWQDLWQTKDQQAQQAYQKKEFDQAARLFENPDWKAAAQYKATTQDIGEIKDPKTAVGFYNKGNVQAKIGEYEKAIGSYLSALNKAANDTQLIEDIKYNKDVVEKALKKKEQEQQDKKQGEKQQDNKQDNKQDGQQEKSGDQSQQSDEQKQADQKPEQSEEKKTQQQQADEQKSADEKQQAEEQKAKDEKQQAEEQKAKDAKQQADKAKQTEAKEDKGQDPRNREPAYTKPTDEQQQANEQWLKRIPDDPAGLLRRKFKYQYGQRGRQTQGDDGGY